MYPIGSMYGIFTYILLIFMVNVGILYILPVPWILWVSPISDLAQMEWVKKGVNPSHVVEEMKMSILQQTNITMENQLHLLRRTMYNCIICTFFQHKSGVPTINQVTSGGNIP